MILKLTRTEWEMIEHRLTLDDCLADCLSDAAEDETPRYQWDEVQIAAIALYWKLDKDPTKTLDSATLTPLEKEILADCIDGSTFFANSEDAVAGGTVTRGWLLSRLKVAQTLEAKFKLAGIETTGFPQH